MPTYQYVCTECGHELEAFQAFTDDALTVCPVCEGKLRKVYGSVGVVFKGSGFYRNDSRSSSSESLNPVKKDSAAAAKDSPSSGSDSASKTTASAPSAGSGSGSGSKSGSDKSGGDKSGGNKSGPSTTKAANT